MAYVDKIKIYDDTYDLGSVIEKVALNIRDINVPITLQYKNIVENGTYSADSGYDGLGTVQVNVSSTPNLQNKSVNVTSNGTSTVQKDSGYDGLGTVTINTNVPGGIVDISNMFDSVTDSINLNTSKIKTGSNRVKIYECFKNTKDIQFTQNLASNSDPIYVYNMRRAFQGYLKNGGTQLDTLNLTRLRFSNDDADIDNNAPLGGAFERINVKNLILHLEVTSRRMNWTWGYDYDNAQNIETIQGLNIKHKDGYPSGDTVTMECTFKQCNKLTSISTINPSEDNIWVIRGGMYETFFYCSSLTSLPVINRKISASPVNNSMEQAFMGCSSLVDLNINIIDDTGDGSARTWTGYQTFKRDSKLKNILGNFDLSKISNTNEMFKECSALEKIETSGSFGGGNTSTTSLTLDLSDSSVFDGDTFIKSLAANGSGKERIIKLSSSSYGNLTQEAIDAAANKNYVLQSA